MRNDRMKSKILAATASIVLFSNLTVHAVDNVYVGSYDPTVDYRKEMYKCALLGDECSMAMGHIYEIQRNMKLQDLGRKDEKTSYFHPRKSGEEIATEMIVDSMKKEYPVAAKVYEYLNKNGYSDVTIAGILGNMMNETGGNTLNLNPYVYELEHGMHYGLCQWSIKFFPEVNGLSFEDQLAYFTQTIDEHMTPFHGSLNDFKECATPEVAANYFSTYYERGGNTAQRELNAETAYNWIIGFKEA